MPRHAAAESLESGAAELAIGYFPDRQKTGFFRGVTSEHLGRWRWVLERTLGWLHRFRRVSIQYEH